MNIWARVRMERQLTLARTSLVRARVLKQKSQVAREMLSVMVTGDGVASVEGDLNKLAKHHRLRARDALREFEKLNGQMFRCGETVWPLKDALDGFNFIKWQQYADQYDNDNLFRGKDPW